MLLLTANDNDRTVEVRNGETFRLTLPENATTGFRWAIDRIDREYVREISDVANYPASALGAGGQITFEFVTTKPGECEIVLKRWRHWEGDSSIAERFRILVRVR
jgi:inhibitor of cysteine peptidase